MLTEYQRLEGLKRLRQDISLSTLSVDPIRALVWRVLLFKGDGWSTRNLAGYTRQPKTTMIRKCRDLERAGIIERVKGRWCLTAYGRAACELLFLETLCIAHGAQIGYTPELIEKSGKISRVHADAHTISFSPRIPMPGSPVQHGPQWP